MKIVEPIRKPSDIKKVKDKLSNNPRNLLLFAFGINTGLRISDILKLRVKDVRNKKHVVIFEQKTNKYKKVLIMNELRSEISKYVEGKKEDTYLFKTQRKNEPISRVQAYRIITNACNNAKIKENIGTHTLRKTFGYHFYKKTKDIALLQSILNHSSPKITLRYIGVNQDIIDKSLKDFYL